jgi:hypothetical protein
LVLYEFKLISPLAIKFSQKRVRPEFQDGRPIEWTYKQINISEKDITNSEIENNDYDCFIRAPFPPIEIVRWKPREIDDMGELVLAADGSSVLGEEVWYTLDNRRLVCLQRAAVSMWPKIACCAVVVMDELPKQSVARKFRSVDYGATIRIGRRFNDNPIDNELKTNSKRDVTEIVEIASKSPKLHSESSFCSSQSQD